MAPTANELDLTARPAPQPGVVVVEVGDESVVLDGWREANVLSPSATQVWERLDGRRTLAEVADELAGLFDADRDLLAVDVVELARHLGNLGLLDGVDPDPAENAPDIVAVPVPVVSEAGETIVDLEVLDIDGDPTRLLDIDAASCLLVNWSPHCGYSASLLGDLERLDPLLADAGAPLVLFAYGSAEASRTQAELSDWHPRVLLKPPHELGPFVGHGTPAAFHLDGDGVLLSPAATGTKDVLRLAAKLAGVAPGQSEPESPAGARHLLERGGSCAPGTGAEPVARWVGTRVYRIDGYNIGLRYTSEQAATVLDDLFERKTVEDPRAGHIFTIALTDADTPGDDPQENLLVIGSQLLVRSRYRERVLRALLWRLGDMMGGGESGADLVRVNATAVMTPVGAALLQPYLYTLEEHLQPAFARYGIAFVDVVNPQIDLERAELVVPEPTVTHNSAGARTGRRERRRAVVWAGTGCGVGTRSGASRPLPAGGVGRDPPSGRSGHAAVTRSGCCCNRVVRVRHRGPGRPCGGARRPVPADRRVRSLVPQRDAVGRCCGRGVGPRAVAG
ncbi:MAG: PqqD family peptide modification chaperone [Microthrixaceae bacterium]